MDLDFGQYSPADITFINDQLNKTEDHIDRAAKHLKNVQLNNQLLRKQIKKIKENPKEYIKPIRDQLTSKINTLRDENQLLKRMIQRSKVPGFCEMTKKKMYDDPFQNESQKQNLRSSYRQRGVFDEIDSNYDKNDAVSTCFNYAPEKEGRQIVRVFHETENDVIARAHLTEEIITLLKKAEIFQQELTKISKDQNCKLKKINKRDQKMESEARRIEQYKTKLIKLLNQLRNRQLSMSQMVKVYRQMHQQTQKRLNQAIVTLNSLREAKISEDVDQKYAQVLQLQERLRVINGQLEEMNETKWLQQIVKQLRKAVNRMGIDVQQNKNLRQQIDQLCQLLIECHISSQKDGATKLNMLKQYHQEQKKNNNKYVTTLKSKEQALGRKLINIQMDK